MNTNLQSSQGGPVLLDAGQAGRAVTSNNDQWTGGHRAEILDFLGQGSDPGRGFTVADVQQVARLQAGAGLDTDGMIGPATMAVLLHRGLCFSRQDTAQASAVTLLFYPGEFEDLLAWRQQIDGVLANGDTYRNVAVPPGAGSLYVEVGGRLVGRYPARGGPPFKVPDAGGHTAGPTQTGTFSLGPGRPVVISSWPYSQIPWGAEVRQAGDDVQFRVTGSAAWQWATGPHSALQVPLRPSDFAGLDPVEVDGATHYYWTRNDFGPLGWNLLGTDDFIHTTPDCEAAAQAGQPVVLPPSHGCIHLVPADRDEMAGRGYLQAGVRIQVKPYDQGLLPASLRAGSPAQA